MEASVVKALGLDRGVEIYLRVMVNCGELAFDSDHWKPWTVTKSFKMANKLGDFRRQLVRRPSPIERRMRKHLESMGLQYDFQFIIAPYIVDFHLPKHKIVIEVDGYKYHSEAAQIDKDHARDKELTRRGYRVLRILGWQVLQEAVVKGLINDFMHRLDNSRLPVGTQGLQTLAVAQDR